ncbi:MAG TPA: tetratricopeptide repeat protein [Steroidobacteraceae bacterium]
MNKVAKVAMAGAVAMVLGTLSGALWPGVAATAVAADAPASGKPQVSAAAGKDLIAAQKDMKEQKWDDMLVELDKVKANPKKNEYDEFLMNEFYVTAYFNKKQLQQVTGPLEATIASKYSSPEDVKKRVVVAAGLYYELKNYDKAIEYANRAMKDGYGTDKLQLIAAQSYYLKNDFKDANRAIQGMVSDEIKAGQVPTEENLKLGLSAASKINDDAASTHWLELLVTYHPNAEYWQNLLDGLYRGKPTDKQLLQVYRLSLDVGAIKRGSDYAEMAQMALDAGSPGEAVATLNKAFADNVFTATADKNRYEHLLNSAKKQAAADQATLAKTEAEAADAPNGDRLIGTGIGYFGYGNYAKAIKDISAGLAKGTGKSDPEDARLLLGIAQFKSGDKDSAIKTFKSVKGDPTLQRIAGLWVLHVKATATA